jgi:hypothetical protein
VDGLWQRLKDRARVCYPIENFEYGMRELAIYDNNGYLLQFGQPASRVLTSAFLKVAGINTGTLVPHNRGDQFGKNVMADIYFRS